MHAKTADKSIWDRTRRTVHNAVTTSSRWDVLIYFGQNCLTATVPHVFFRALKSNGVAPAHMASVQETTVELRDITSHPSLGVGAKSENYAALIVGIIGAAFFIFAGFQMLDIQSVFAYRGDSESITERFYHTVGWLSYGLARLSVVLGCMGWRH